MHETTFELWAIWADWGVGEMEEAEIVALAEAQATAAIDAEVDAETVEDMRPDTEAEDAALAREDAALLAEIEAEVLREIETIKEMDLDNDDEEEELSKMDDYDLEEGELCEGGEMQDLAIGHQGIQLSSSTTPPLSTSPSTQHSSNSSTLSSLTAPNPAPTSTTKDAAGMHISQLQTRILMVKDMVVFDAAPRDAWIIILTLQVLAD